MRICSDHFAWLRADLAKAGLLAMVACEGGERFACGYDPMARAKGAIFGTFVWSVRAVGHDQMLLGDRCPLCQLEAIELGAAEYWIASAVESQLLGAAALADGQTRQ